MNAEIIVIDFFSVVSGLTKQGHKVTGTPVPGLVDYVRAEQAKGSTIFFIGGAAHDPFSRQIMERLIESIGIRAVFVTHGLPEGFTKFISSKAFTFDGEHFPIQT
jgi:UDP-N-acetyl-D-mannosaminuronic acid transferase (WecB/TagA/CpsF family)